MNGHTIFFDKKPRIISTGTVAGPKECAGVVGKYVDMALSDDMFGESTYEKAECKMLTFAIQKAIENAALGEEKIDMLISGDLLNQIISASFAARDFDFPFLGVYGACSRGGADQCGIFPEDRSGDGQSLFLGRAAVPLSAGTRYHAPAAVSMDGDGRRRSRPCRARQSYRGDGRDVREGSGFRNHGRE